MAWVDWWGAGGVPVSLMLGLVAWMPARWALGMVEMWLRARLDARAEREERATMLAVAGALQEGGAAARFAEGQPSWIFYKNTVSSRPALDPGEAA
ncbi:hypothetical protein ACH4RA_18565 [Streptomyces smyrnaeus]|uniref:hypothetical protein n=1 Tax=Streptomyces smyrnaeus TaxID=1387713 RepID=UPI0037AD4A5D